MSLLAPLYFLGALAVGLPVLFHLIRRRPKGEVEFSSLMFLKPTPPRLTRRSRLENLPLLLIRALALVLLAAAFARPFLRETAQSDIDGMARRIVMAIDTSASMRRADLWQQAKAAAADVVRDIQPGDQLAIVSFDDRPQVMLGFDQSAQLTPSQIKQTAMRSIDDLTPTWNVSDLGQAVGFSADLAVTHETDDDAGNVVDATAPTTSTESAHLVLITDMQVGSELESLQVYAWPDELNLDVRKVGTEMTSNAWARIMATDDQAPTQEDREDRVRVRVSNTADSEKSQFRLAWKHSDGSIVADSQMPVQVPPGESRVVPMPAPIGDVTMLQLLDDDHPFDNDTYVAKRDPVSQRLLYVGRESDPSLKIQPKDSLFYYLSRVPLSHRFRRVAIEKISEAWPATLDPNQVPLVTVSSRVSTEQSKLLKDYIKRGGRVLVVFANADEADDLLISVRELTGATTLSATEATVDDYVMLSQIKFSDPVFSSMSDPQFNDFTKIQFWRHCTLTSVPESWNVLATYDDGDPALLEVRSEKNEGKGKLWILTSGWQPESSQLALSTKFIPMVYQWFDTSAGEPRQSTSYTIGQPIDAPPSPDAKIVGPDGSSWSYESTQASQEIDRPGLYRFVDGDQTYDFAVNVAESESRTEAMDDDALERFGVKLGAAPTAQQLQDSGRQLRDIELEGRQKLWQWLLIGGLAMLLLESWLGGKMSRSSGTATA